jgi:hypothetical protein
MADEVDNVGCFHAAFSDGKVGLWLLCRNQGNPAPFGAIIITLMPGSGEGLTCILVPDQVRQLRNKLDELLGDDDPQEDRTPYHDDTIAI